MPGLDTFLADTVREALIKEIGDEAATKIELSLWKKFQITLNDVMYDFEKFEDELSVYFGNAADHMIKKILVNFYEYKPNKKDHVIVLKDQSMMDHVLKIVSDTDSRLIIKILKQKAHARSFELSDDVVEYLIVRVNRDLGSLMEVLDKIDHASLAAKRKITIPFVKELIS